MKIKKTVGFTARIEKRKKKLARACDLRKSYTIHTDCGEQFTAEADGSKGYLMRGTKYKSLKEAKEAIVTQGLEIYFPAPEAVPAAAAPIADGVDAWDCVHPCAFMVRWIKTHTPTSLETLDKYGWLDEYGRPDSEKADREFARVGT